MDKNKPSKWSPFEVLNVETHDPYYNFYGPLGDYKRVVIEEMSRQLAHEIVQNYYNTIEVSPSRAVMDRDRKCYRMSLRVASCPEAEDIIKKAGKATEFQELYLEARAEVDLLRRDLAEMKHLKKQVETARMALDPDF